LAVSFETIRSDKFNLRRALQRVSLSQGMPVMIRKSSLAKQEPMRRKHVIAFT